MKLTQVLIATALIALAGCASRPKIDPNIDWNKRIGAYTYEQAVVELGKPDRVAESSEGKTAQWIIKRRSSVSVGVGVGGGFGGPHVATGVGVGSSVHHPTGGESLNLTFGPDGKLKSWTKLNG